MGSSAPKIANRKIAGGVDEVPLPDLVWPPEVGVLPESPPPHATIAQPIARISASRIRPQIAFIASPPLIANANTSRGLLTIRAGSRCCLQPRQAGVHVS